MTNRIHPAEFAILALIIAIVAVCAMVARSAPASGLYELARYTGAGDRYVDDYGLSYDDCIAALEAPHASALRCEVER